MKNCLLLGRKALILKDIQQALTIQDAQLFSGTSLADVKEVFGNHSIDSVIMGAGIQLKDRLEMIEHIFENSTSTTVHMKDWDSGPAGMLPFVKRVLEGTENR